jgi:hypothetical protein
MVERMAREAGAVCVVPECDGIYGAEYVASRSDIERFAQLVAAECARICDATTEYGATDQGGETRAYASSAAIRERFGIKEGE